MCQKGNYVLREAIIKKTVVYEKIDKPGGRVCRISQNLFFSSSKSGKNGENGPKENKTSQNPYRAGGSAFYELFS